MNKIVPILLYHSITESVSSQFQRWNVPPRIFAHQMADLHAQGYKPLTVSDFVYIITSANRDLPVRPVIITFDDGFACFYTNALPVLQRYHFNATLYITTGYVGSTSRWLQSEGEGQHPMLTWDQISEISASGIECGAHSQTHPQLDTLSPIAARNEIAGSKLLLEQHLGQNITSFAYPHGYYSPSVRRLVQKSGYLSACGVKHAMSGLNDDHFALSRIIVTGDAVGSNFRRLLAGHNLPISPVEEQLRTRLWRVVRRSAKAFSEVRMERRT